MKSCLSMGGRAAGLLLAVLALAHPAAADTIYSPGVDPTRGQGFWMNERGSNVDAYFGGVIFIEITDAQGRTFDRDTFCVDLFTNIYIGRTYNTTVLHPTQVVPNRNLGRVSWLVDNALLPVQDPSYPSEIPDDELIPPAPAQGAGLQFAIWDIVHDNGDGFSAGQVRASTDPAHPTDAQVLYWAQRYEMLSIGKHSDLAYIYENVDPATGAPAQMLAGPRFGDGGPHPLPEPSTGAVLAAALVAFGCFAARRRR